jgi:prepilin-type N-terminal cleavage/methylation domain-containing protein
MILPSKNLLKAFTLIELLMVVSILTIVAGITIPSFTGYMKNQTLKNAQDQFKSDLRSVQNLALTGSKYDTSVTYNSITSPAKYWVLKWNNAGSTYTSYLIYDFIAKGSSYTAICASLSGSSVTQTSYNLPSGVTFLKSKLLASESVCTNECIFFNMFDGGTQFTSTTGSNCNTNNLNEVKIILQNESLSTAPVSWNRNGMIGS